MTRDDNGQSIAQALHDLHTRLDGALVAHPCFEHSPVFTVGGPSGTYEVAPYFSTPAEFCVCAVSFEGTGSVAIAQTTSVMAPATGSTLDPSRNVPGLVLASASQSLTPVWQRLPANATIHISTQVASTNSAYVALQFRRRVTPAGVPLAS